MATAKKIKSDPKNNGVTSVEYVHSSAMDGRVAELELKVHGITVEQVNHDSRLRLLLGDVNKLEGKVSEAWREIMNLRQELRDIRGWEHVRAILVHPVRWLTGRL